MERNTNERTGPDQQESTEMDEQPFDPEGRVDGTAGTEDLTSIEQELIAERQRAAEYLDQAQRARAEFANYRRRTEEELDRMREQAGERIISRLLPALDDLDRAIESMDDEIRQTPWGEGLLLVQRKLSTTLEAEGVRPIEALGHPFDPSLHEAVSMQGGTNGEQLVIQEYQRGYMLGDRVIRASMVVVGSADDLPEGVEPTRNVSDEEEAENNADKQSGQEG